MILSELLAFLTAQGRRPNRKLSQNFLIDKNIVAKIIKTAGIFPGDQVLEIGPGPGSLTLGLLEAGASVTAVEMDPVFARELPRFQTSDKRLQSIHADFLKFDLSSLRAPIKVVANLPYHITTPILEILIEASPLFESMTVMVQSELADRMTAQAGSKAMSSLTLFLQFYTHWKTSFKVSSESFYPKPSVDSKVIQFIFQKPPLSDPKPFFLLVRKAFQQRRKMIRVSLSEVFTESLLLEALEAAQAKPTARPEELSLPQWLLFYGIIEKVAATVSAL